MVLGRCKIVDAMDSRGGYQEPILDHRIGHYVRPNKVALKYPNFKNDVDPHAHVKMFNFVVKENAKTFEEYIIMQLTIY
jgi:hypothetical protein